jgi:lipopolysaccharide/colanic/teichoic acid biosynthesis glycosyltransferase
MKRFLDLLYIFLSFPLIFFLLILLIFMVLINMGRPVFYTQMRPGKNGQIFKLIKFRSMTNQKDSNGVICPDKERLTKFGNFLRSTSLDELPSLWNVFKGEMSLVGPRPLLQQYLPLYSKRQARRHEIKPGVTGWAQINGRNAISWDEKLELDIWYVDNQSTWLDMKILCLTLKTVIMRKGISSNAHVTMDLFKGNHER